MRTRTPRTLLLGITAAVVFLLGGSTAGVAQIVPPVTTSTTVAPAPTTTVPPTTAPSTTVTPTTAPETKLIPVPQNTILDPAKPGTAPATTKPGDPPTSTTAPPASLSAGQAEMFVRDQARTAASSTAALIEALRPLQNLGMTAQESLALGMGRFPVLGLANWNDDWLDYRAGPPVHAHQGTDVFSAFDTPVRSPVDGTVRYEDAGLGGKGAFVTAADGTYYYMAHLNSFHADVRNGAAVKEGQVIGYNGDSGNAKGGAPHVHFEVHPGGGAAVNPKPFLDIWLQQAMDKVPELIASFQPKPDEGATETIDGGVPQILMTTGLTRRFSAPALTAPHRERPAEDFTRAVLGPLTPPVLAPLLEAAR
ncbi:MAG TPA: M23 family metallopeptidase [Acidimicrobiales bacterium]|nr:M23 family metallopeptidase [Acidimicrobiales bacterium]